MDRIITIDELLAMLPDYDYKEFHIHHTASPKHKDYQPPEKGGLYWQAAMRRYHVGTRKFADIAQHVTLLPDGLFVTGRGFDREPASISGKNTKAFMVEMFGCFNPGEDKLEGAQKNSILRLAKYFDDKKVYIRFHRESAATDCPGNSINKEDFLREVRATAQNNEVELLKKQLEALKIEYETYKKRVREFVEKINSL